MKTCCYSSLGSRKMYKLHDLENYVASPEAKLPEILAKLDATKGETVFLLDSNRRLVGSITDGDLRRFLRIGVTRALDEIAAHSVANEFPYFLEESTLGDGPRGQGVACIPVVNKRKELLYLLNSKRPTFNLGPFEISENSRTLCIAEIGNNHQGSLELAKQLVDKAAQSGADIVKFQHRNVDALYSKRYTSFDLGSQYVFDLVNKFQLSKDDMFRCFDYCDSKAISFTCTPFDNVALQELESYGLDYYKVASADFLNVGLVDAIIESKKPFLISTGMVDEKAIRSRLEAIAATTEKFVALHCNSTYPAPFKDLQMNFMDNIANYGNGYVGYSGHEQGIAVAIASVLRGTKIVEKHFTLDRGLEGNDHKVSLLPDELLALTKGIKEIQAAYSDEGLTRGISQGEKANKLALGKGLYFRVSAKKGTIVETNLLEAKSPVLGLPVEAMDEVIGGVLNRDVCEGDPIVAAHLEASHDLDAQALSTNFYIPVRHMDCHELIREVNSSRVEFHLSYADMDLDPKELPWDEISSFSVHAPELFPNDRILDLSSSDNAIWDESLSNLRRVVDYTLKLREFRPSDEPTNMVINAGGATDVPTRFDLEEKQRMYARVNQGLSDALGFCKSEINACIQTMPPFPWHFGGRRFHNLFVTPDEIQRFCKEYGWSLCLDTSHSMMACTELGIHFPKYYEEISKYVKHIHLADCLGVDGEGVATGDGDFDFSDFLSLLRSSRLDVPLILEEWQGHMHKGAGFKSASKYLRTIGYE